jgi:hypothetical protein
LGNSKGLLGGGDCGKEVRAGESSYFINIGNGNKGVGDDARSGPDSAGGDWRVEIEAIKDSIVGVELFLFKDYWLDLTDIEIIVVIDFTNLFTDHIFQDGENFLKLF